MFHSHIEQLSKWLGQYILFLFHQLTNNETLRMISFLTLALDSVVSWCYCTAHHDTPWHYHSPSLSLPIQRSRSLHWVWSLVGQKGRESRGNGEILEISLPAECALIVCGKTSSQTN